MNSSLSIRSFLMLLTLGLMPPLLKLIPSASVTAAGRAGWLVPMAALPALLVGIRLVSWAGRDLPEGAGLGDALCLWLGRTVGRLLCVAEGIWLLMIASVALRYCAERFASTIYPETGLGLFFFVILALEWYLGRRKLAVTARAGQVFFYLMLVVLAVVLLLAMGNVQAGNVLPVWTDDLPRLGSASLPVLSAWSTAVGWLFLFGEVTQRQEGTRLTLLWGIAMTVGMTVLGFAVMGVFGPNLTARLQIPFFSLSKEIQIGSAVQRVEPLVVTMWVLADVVSVALLLRSAETAFRQGFGIRRRCLTPLLLLVLPGAYLCAGSFFALDEIYRTVFVPGGLILFGAVPLAAAVVGKVRKNVRKRG